MNGSTWNWAGARWWKVDFHTHTPASDDYGKGPEQAKLKMRSPRDWLLNFMRAEIDCVAVTDHTSGAWIDRLKDALAELAAKGSPDFRPLTLFPGVELSVHGGVHVLAILDPSKTTSDIDTLLGAVGFAGTKGKSDAVTTKRLVEVVEAIEAPPANGIAIPAHVDGPSGLFQLRGTTLEQVLDCQSILAMEVVDAAASKPQIYLQRKLSWTEVLGSDAHHPSGAKCPGSHYTWIKMTRPTLDGLRLALHDGERFSVRRSDEPGPFDPFAVPEHAIAKVTISDARYMGRGKPATLAFSPWFNALVGGRGTGKSTVVHGLRLAYRRDDELKLLGEESEPRRVFDAFRRLPKSRADRGGLLAGTEIVVGLLRDGVPHRLRWRQDATGAVVEQQDSGGSWQPSQSQSVTPDRFPIRIFSQGQIAALAGESQEALLGIIDEAAGSQTARQRLDEAGQRFLSLRAQVRELDGKLKGRDDVKVKLADVVRKLAGFEGKEHAEILKRYQVRARQQREVGRQLEGTGLLVAAIEKVAAETVLEDLPATFFDANDAADASVLAIIGQLHATVAKAAESVRAAGADLATAVAATQAAIERSAWRAAMTGAKGAYDTLVSELKDQGVADPSEYGRLVQERQRLDSELLRYDALEAQRDGLEAGAVEQEGTVRAARRALSAVRRDFLATTLANNPYVQIELVPYGRDARAIERSLREVLGATDDRFADDILVVDGDVPKSGLVADLLGKVPSDPVKAASEIETRLATLAQRFAHACSGQAEFGGFFNNYLQRECGKRPELLDRLVVFSPEDTLAVEYSRRGDGTDFVSIGQASAGQRAAAMLAFLLAHGSEPLVLDQPEDDLDNHLIYELVVRQIRENKMRRQLIVVTHNPNVVVNGDAEMLHALDFRAGHCLVVESGSLQERAMRDEVCRVMEGGREAFERRYRRLGREL
jgi:hypothetical protein